MICGGCGSPVEYLDGDCPDCGAQEVWITEARTPGSALHASQ